MTKRVMVTRPNRLGSGIDVGWRMTDRNGDSIELWPMNTRDDDSLMSLIVDAKARYGEFDIEFGHSKAGLA